MIAPKKGVPYNRTEEEVIIPTYVAVSEAPRADGACVTLDLARHPSAFTPAGWYVEFRYPHDGGHPEAGQHRTFIPFPTDT